MRLFFLIVVTLFVSPALAEQPAQSVTPQQGDRVQIIADQEAGAVRIVIDGQPVAIIDATGLHVRGSVSYGGTMTDYGSSDFEAHAAQREEEPDAP